MSKLLALVVGIVLVGLMVWVPDANSQSEHPWPFPFIVEVISNCDGHGPDRDQVALFRMECIALAIERNCNAGTINPYQQDVIYDCFQEPCNYCQGWGCYLHGCP